MSDDKQNPTEQPELIPSSEPVDMMEFDFADTPVDGEQAQSSESNAESETVKIIESSLVHLGFVNFDGGGADNSTSNAMVAAEHRRNFRRDIYVGIHDEEQGVDFLGRVVEGPFHVPHEVSIDSAITRTTVLHPDRTRFRPTYYVEGTIEVLGQLAAGERLVPSPTRPRHSDIYMFPPERLKNFLGISGSFNLGSLMGYDEVQVTADVDNKNFLPRNVGIFGTVGSGKSNTTQVLMEEATKAGWAVVAIDVEGEYVQMDKPTDEAALAQVLKDKYSIEPEGISDFRVYVPGSGHSEARAAVPFKVPISEIDPWILSDLMELSEPQARLLEAVIGRAARLQPPGSGRTGPLAPAGGGQPQRRFTLQTLIDGLTESGQDFPLAPNLRQHEISTAWTLRSKLVNLGRTNMLDTATTSATPELPINELLVGGRLSVLDVSETDDRSRNIAIAYTLGALFDRVIQTSVGSEMPSGLPRPKVLVVIEEVHTFVSRANASKMRSVLDNLQVISRRGRKRWMSLALVSQQPGHVPDELFELANTRFIHQLKSVANMAPVKQTTGGVHEALWSTLPSLGPGQCLLTGAIFKNPLFVEMRPAQSKRMLTS